MKTVSWKTTTNHIFTLLIDSVIKMHTRIINEIKWKNHFTCFEVQSFKCTQQPKSLGKGWNVFEKVSACMWTTVSWKNRQHRKAAKEKIGDGLACLVPLIMLGTRKWVTGNPWFTVSFWLNWATKNVYISLLNTIIFDSMVKRSGWPVGKVNSHVNVSDLRKGLH